MSECPNCHVKKHQTIFTNACSFCGYPYPKWSNTSLICVWSMLFIICFIAIVLHHWFVIIVLFIQSFGFFSIINSRKNKTFLPPQKPNKDEITSIDTTSQTNNDSKSSKCEQQEQKFEDIRDNLTIIWNSSIHLIVFEYEGKKRKILLDKVEIDLYDEVCFSGYCYDSKENETFKVKIFESSIEYSGKKYEPRQFLTNVLDLNPEYVKYLIV